MTDQDIVEEIFPDGDCNTGDNNTGDYNTGDHNTGDRNTGNGNTGNRNAGHRNTGYCNTGSRNAGHYNTGHHNTGHHNTGDYNIGDRHLGVFGVGDAPFLSFGKPTDRNLFPWRRAERLWEAAKQDTFDYSEFLDIPNATIEKIKEWHEALKTARAK